MDRIVDLGRFYDLTAAKPARRQIMALTTRSQAAQLRAERYLLAARQMELESVSAARGALDWARAQARLEGVISRELRRKGNGVGRTGWRFLGGCTCQGTVWRFDSVDVLCPRVYVFVDRWELAGPLLERLRQAAVGKGWDVVACPAPEEPERLEHLLIPDLGLAFVTSRPGMEYGGKPYRRFRLDALTHPAEPGRLRLQSRVAATLREEAVTALQEAKALHDELEQIYNPYVDFDEVRAMAAIESGRLLSWRNRRPPCASCGNGAEVLQ